MSEENVEVVRQVYDAANRHDTERIFSLYDPEVELDASRLEMDHTRVVKGHEGLRAFFREWNEAWEGVDYSYEELIDAGDDRVVSVVTRHGRGRASGIEVERPFALVWTIRHGKVVRVVWFLERTKALEAAGLSE